MFARRRAQQQRKNEAVVSLQSTITQTPLSSAKASLLDEASVEVERQQ